MKTSIRENGDFKLIDFYFKVNHKKASNENLFRKQIALLNQRLIINHNLDKLDDSQLAYMNDDFANNMFTLRMSYKINTAENGN